MKNSIFSRFTAIIVLAILFNFQANAQFTFYGMPPTNERFRENFHLNGFYYASGTDGEATLTKINATTQMMAWNRKYFGMFNSSGSPVPIFIDGICESHSNNLMVSGFAWPNGTSWNNTQFVVMEININTGDILQTRTFDLGTNNNDHRFSSVKIIKALNGASAAGTTCGGPCAGEYIVHVRRANGGGAFDEPMLVKLDYSLNPVWANTYTDGNEWETYNLVGTPSGGAVVVGVTIQPAQRHGILMEVDCMGNLVAINGYRTASGEDVYFTNIIRDYTTSGNGNLIVTGGRFLPTGQFQGLIVKINAGSYLPIWFKGFNKPAENVLFTGLAQLQTTSGGNIYTGYWTPDASNPGFFEPRVLRVNTGTGAFMGYRDLGGPNSSPFIDGHLRLTTNGTNRVTVATGMPGPIGADDAYLEIVPNTLSTTGCANAVTQAAVNVPLTVTALQPVQTNVLPFLTSVANCSPAVQPWDRIPVTCPPYGNKPASPTVNEFASNPHNAELEAYKQAIANSKFEIGNPKIEARGTKPEAPNPKLEMEIQPNPASQNVEISFPGGEGMDTQVEILDLNGKLLKTLTVNDAEQTTLDISDLPQGVFLLKSSNGSAQKLTKL